MRFQQNPLRIRSALATVFVSPAKPRSRPPRLLACHNYSSQSFGASSILLFKAAGTVIYASKIAPCPRLGPFAHGTFPIRWATSGVDFVQPSSRSPRSPQSKSRSGQRRPTRLEVLCPLVLCALGVNLRLELGSAALFWQHNLS